MNYWLITFFILTGLIEALWGVAQAKGWVISNFKPNQPSGSFFNSGPYGGYLAMILPMALYYVLNDSRIFRIKLNRRLIPYIIRGLISVLTVISICYILPIANSRASWLAAIISCTLVILGFILKIKKIHFSIFIKKHKFKLGIASVICLIALTCTVNHLYGLRKTSADIRTLIWKISLPIIPENKSGVGIGNYLGEYSDAHIKYFESGKATQKDKNLSIITWFSFNEYLTICIEFGILGLILYLLAIGSAIYKGLKQRKHAVVGSIISLSVFATMSYPFSVLPFIISIVFLLAQCRTNYSYNKPIKSRYTQTEILVVVLSIVIIPCLINRYNYYKAYKRWGYLTTNTARFGLGLVDEYEKLERYLCDNPHFINEYALRLTKKGDYEKSIFTLEKGKNISVNFNTYFALADNYKKMKNYSIAENYILAGMKLLPNQAYDYYILLDLYIEARYFDKAQKILDILKKQNPKAAIINIFEERIENYKKADKILSAFSN